ncbi:MotA/TolQ/ExbB proton channel family protein [Aliiglaciecola sp. SL4]|uniref:MotA/TolQ/ExbB proton channel family protein n=1 Tax=Aliiglaciecola sp. SL4 TaxID=3239806 RepID=UPI00355B9BC7
MTSLEKEESYYRLVVLLAMSFIAFVIIIVGFVLTEKQPSTSTEMRLADILFDRSGPSYPFTIQNVMWLFFFICAGEIWVRWQRATQEINQINRGLISDDEDALYRPKDLGPIYQAIKADNLGSRFYLQRLIKRIILQFQLSRSTEQANNLMNSSLELMQHEVDLKYTMVRYLVWLIPTLGFIGTVIGIAMALSSAGDMPPLSDSDAIKDWVAVITIKLGVAFNTTLLALIMSAALVFFMHLAQGREEKALNLVGQYCLDRLVNRLIAAD